jgi:hypothetical protein
VGRRPALAAALAALAAAAAPLAAAAQESAPLLPDDPRAPRFAEVERGLFTGFEAGWLFLTKTPTANPGKYPFAGAGGGSGHGLLVGGSLGYDFGRVALAAFVLGAHPRAGVSYGDFSVFAGGLDGRVALLAASDRQGVERLYVYLHARGGYARSYPAGLFGTNDLFFAGGPGVEYYTRLRHFSVGLAVDGAYFTKAKAPGVAVVPTLRYTF